MAQARSMPNPNDPSWVNLISRFTDRMAAQTAQDNRSTEDINNMLFREKVRQNDIALDPERQAARRYAVGQADLALKQEAIDQGLDPESQRARRVAAGNTQPTQNITARAKEVYNYVMTNHGLKPHQAAAFVGNALAESSLNPRATHDVEAGRGPTGIGIFGFRDPAEGSGRRTNLFRWAKANNRDPYDVFTQVDYAMHEFKTTERANGERLFSAENINDANKAMLHFLRPKGYKPDNPLGGHNAAGRLRNSAAMMNTMRAGLPSQRSNREVLAQQAATENALTDQQGNPYRRVPLSRRDAEMFSKTHPGRLEMDDQINPDGTVFYRLYDQPIDRLRNPGMQAAPMPASRGVQAAPKAPTSGNPSADEEEDEGYNEVFNPDQPQEELE